MLFFPGVLSAIVWSWLLLRHGTFWRSGPVLDAAQPTRRLKITVVIPARNEADHIANSLHSLMAQHVNGDLRIVVVDDNSSDGTGDLARTLAAQNSQLHVVTGAVLQAGWTGKMWAVSQGLSQPESQAADFVLLTDADIIHQPGHVAALAARAEREQIDLVSEMVRLRCESFAERATIPAFIFFFQMLYPFRSVNDERRAIAAAAGGSMLLSRAALDRVGGVSKIRSALIDDVALAREVKRGGHRIWLGHADCALSERQYPALPDIWHMISRTAYVQLNYSPWILVGVCAGMAVLYLEPVLGALFGSGEAKYLGLACWLAMTTAFQPTLRRYRRSPLWGFALPAIAVFYACATLGSAYNFYRGRGGNWKNRVYPAAKER